ncbi:MAG: hypothetical protein FJ144_10230 [Deltaproteobacteria bacterium]|nr:hypothetical protein [Deltaproteobacteria bacterium]
MRLHHVQALALSLGSAALLAATGCGGGTHGSSSYPLDDELRLNQVQVLGSHNSYHIQPREPLFSALAALVPPLARAWEYTHLPLGEQFETQGVRQIELDVFADPEGGLYDERGGPKLLTGNGASNVPELREPGFKVLHVQDLDFESTCWTFVQCLEDVRAWSEAHPGHAPIAILVEAKDDPIDAPFESVVPILIEREELDALDAEIRSVFTEDQMITPDDVRGDHATLEEAIREDGWPTLEVSRGKVLFALDNENRVKDDYVEGHPSLRGRVLFVSARPGEPEAAFVKLNDPIGSFDLIQQLVGEGFLIRTRADGDTEQARTGDTTQRDAAIASGAQYVSSDYPVPNPAFGTGYFVEIPGGTPGRCNPISAPRDCTSHDVESPDFLESLDG